MFRSVMLISASLALLLSGCGSRSLEPAETPAEDTPKEGAERAPKKPAATAAKDKSMVPEELAEVDMVWADEVFLVSSTVKEGKDVIYLPSPPMVVDKMIEMAEIKPTDVVYDLGTGDGRIAIGAAKACGCRVVGYELDADLVEQARENVRKESLENLVTIQQQDILKLDLSPADVILMYLTVELNVRLIPQLAQLKPGSRIVSHDSGMNGKLENGIVIENFVSKLPDFVNVHTLYMWEAPIKLKE